MSRTKTQDLPQQHDASLSIAGCISANKGYTVQLSEYQKNKMYSVYILLVVIALGSIGGGLYLFGEAKNTHDRRKAIAKMYDDEQRHITASQRSPLSSPQKNGE